MQQTPQPRQPVVELLDPLVVSILQKKTPEERLAMAFGMWNSARLMVRGVLRQEHPDWSDEEILRETAARISHGATRNVGK